jgi:hypothetical protein
MRDLIQPMRIAPGTAVKLSRDHDPAWTGPVTRPEAGALLEQVVELLAEYQDRLAGQNGLGLLILLQGLDAAGKDSTIKHVMSGVNPQGVAVSSFKEPSAEELDHVSSGVTRLRCPAGEESASSTGGPLVRRPRRPQVVHPPGHGRGRRADAQDYQPQLPGAPTPPLPSRWRRSGSSS